MDDSEAEDEGGQATVFGVAFDWGADDESGGEDALEPDVLRFELAGMSFAVEAEHVNEVGAAPVLTEIPGLPPHVLGVAVRRRHVLSVFDLALFLGLDMHKVQVERLLVFEIGGIEAGIVVGHVAGLEVWPESAEPPELGDLDDALRKFVVAARWAPGGRVLLLDLPELLRAAAVR